MRQTLQRYWDRLCAFTGSSYYLPVLGASLVVLAAVATLAWHAATPPAAAPAAAAFSPVPSPEEISVYAQEHELTPARAEASLRLQRLAQVSPALEDADWQQRRADQEASAEALDADAANIGWRGQLREAGIDPYAYGEELVSANAVWDLAEQYQQGVRGAASSLCEQDPQDLPRLISEARQQAQWEASVEEYSEDAATTHMEAILRYTPMLVAYRCGEEA